MRRNALVWVFLITLVAFSNAGATRADEVIMQNGDRISGTFEKLEAGVLSFKSAYAGELTLPVDEVRQLTTQSPVAVTFDDGGTLTSTQFFNRSIGEQAAFGEGVDLAAVTSISISPKPPVRYTARANVGITTEKGNADTDQYRIDAEGVARTEKQRFTLGGLYNRQKASDELTAANWKAYGLYDYFLRPKWFLNANAIFENDEFADLDLRSTLGVGAGHQVFESEGLNLSISAGFAYINERFILAEDRDYPAAQWLVNYDQYFFNRFVQLFHTNNGSISLENGNDWLINTRQGLRFPITKGILTTLQYNYDYRNNPSPDAISKYNATFMFLLGYTFAK